MESAYEVHERSTYMTRVRVALLIGLAAVSTYLGLDVWVLDTPAPVTQFRVFVGLPLMALAFALSFYLKRSFFPMLAGLLAIVLVGFSATLLFGGRELTTFAVTAYVQSLLYFSVLAMVPFRYVVLVAAGRRGAVSRFVAGERTYFAAPFLACKRQSPTTPR